MNKTILLTIMGLGIAACVPADQATLGGAATGAVLGAAVSDSDDRVEGAIIGGAVGAVAGNLIGRASTPNDCVYEDAYGRRYVARC
jgi:Glycine zipper 2TM domain